MTAVSCERRSAAALSSVNRPARYELSHNIRFADMVEPMFDASDCGAGWIFSLVRDVAAGGATTSRGGSWQPRMRKRSRNEIASCSALQIPRLAFQDCVPRLAISNLARSKIDSGSMAWESRAGSGEAGKLWPALPVVRWVRSISLGLPFNACRTRISRSWAETCRQFRRFL